MSKYCLVPGNRWVKNSISLIIGGLDHDHSFHNFWNNTCKKHTIKTAKYDFLDEFLVPLLSSAPKLCCMAASESDSPPILDIS